MLPLHHDSRGKYGKYGNSGWSKTKIAAGLFLFIVAGYGSMKHLEAENKITTYERQISDIQGQLQTVTADADSQRSEAAALKKQIAELQNTQSNMKINEEKAKQQAASDSSALEALKIQLEIAKQQATESESDKLLLNEQVTSLKDAKSQLESQQENAAVESASKNTKLENENGVLQKRVSELETRLGTLTATHQTTEDALTSANKRAATLEGEVTELKEKLKQSEVKPTATPQVVSVLPETSKPSSPPPSPVVVVGSGSGSAQGDASQSGDSSTQGNDSSQKSSSDSSSTEQGADANTEGSHSKEESSDDPDTSKRHENNDDTSASSDSEGRNHEDSEEKEKNAAHEL